MIAKYWHGRLLLYVIGFVFAVIVDAKTPLGVADWLLELVLVWIAATWGTRDEMTWVAVVGTMTIVMGLFSSPVMFVPFWMGALNRLIAMGVVWTMVCVSRARLIAEEARERAATEIKVLTGLLPICASCKRIRSQSDEWHNLESFITDHSQAMFTHTYCPACVEELFPEMNESAEGAS
jgi:hypothetical protein